MKMKIKITDVTVKDIRFPTSQNLDVMNKDPSYSTAYVTLHTNDPKLKGYGLTFMLGRDNAPCVAAINALRHFLIDKDLSGITEHMGEFWRQVKGDNQLHWLDQNKDVVQISTAAVVNAVWDLWARREKKPLWRLLVDMSPEELVHCLDFSYITNKLLPDEALDILRRNGVTKGKRIAELLAKGYPANATTSVNFCQIDSCRLGCLNEILTVLLMSTKFNLPIHPYAGGVGLCEYVQHLAMVDYIYISGSLENRVLEYVDHLHEHFREPAVVKNGHYQVPTAPGYSIEMKESSLSKYHYPHGEVWKTP